MKTKTRGGEIEKEETPRRGSKSAWADSPGAPEGAGGVPGLPQNPSQEAAVEPQQGVQGPAPTEGDLISAVAASPPSPQQPSPGSRHASSSPSSSPSPSPAGPASASEPAEPNPASPAMKVSCDAGDGGESAAASAPSPKYSAAIPVGNNQFRPVGSNAVGVATPVGMPSGPKIDFEAEKKKIEEGFAQLEEALDNGTKGRDEIEREFDELQKKAATLKRLQAAEEAAAKAALAPRAAPAALAAAPMTGGGGPPPPVHIPKTMAEPRDHGAKPSMAVVHWKGVTKAMFQEYREKLLEKYGTGPDKVKSVERIPNRILITAPEWEVMEKILADEDLEPRPEPYKLPTGAKGPPPKATSALAKPGGLAPLVGPSSAGGAAGGLAPLAPLQGGGLGGRPSGAAGELAPLQGAGMLGGLPAPAAGLAPAGGLAPLSMPNKALAPIVGSNEAVGGAQS